MKAAARKWADEVRIKSGPKLVLQALVHFMNEQTRQCFPKVETLAKRTGQRESTVRAGLRDLEALGLIRTDRRWKDGRQTSNQYHVNVGAKPASSIPKRRDALRKAQQRASQTPMSGAWDSASSHRNPASAQPPDSGPEYYTPNGRDEGEDRRVQPGGRSDSREGRARTSQASGEMDADGGPRTGFGRVGIARPAHDALDLVGPITSRREDDDLTSWLDGDDALRERDAFDAAGLLDAQSPGSGPDPAKALGRPTQPELGALAGSLGERHPWTAEDWRARYGERAGIAEYDGGLSRADAEVLAFEGCVAEWLEQDSTRARAQVCGDRSDRVRQGDARGAVGEGPAWMPLDSTGRWRTGRLGAAIADLQAMGLRASAPAEMGSLAKMSASIATPADLARAIGEVCRGQG